MAIVRMTREEIDKIMTPERRMREIEAMKNCPFVVDPECPPSSPEKLAKFKRANPQLGNPPMSNKSYPYPA